MDESPLRGLVFSPSGFHPLARSFRAWRFRAWRTHPACP